MEVEGDENGTDSAREEKDGLKGRCGWRAGLEGGKIEVRQTSDARVV